MLESRLQSENQQRPRRDPILTNHINSAAYKNYGESAYENHGESAYKKEEHLTSAYKEQHSKCAYKNCLKSYYKFWQSGITNLGILFVTNWCKRVLQIGAAFFIAN